MTTPEPPPINPNLKLPTTTTYTCPHCAETLTINPPTQRTLNLTYRNHADSVHYNRYSDTETIKATHVDNVHYTPYSANETPETIKAIITTGPNQETNPETADITYIHPDGGITTITATLTQEPTTTPPPGEYSYE